MDVQTRSVTGLAEKLLIFKLAVDMDRDVLRKFVYDVDRSTVLNGDLVGLCLDGNWEIWVRGCGSGTVCIFVVRERERERVVGLFNVKSITLSALEMVN